MAEGWIIYNIRVERSKALLSWAQLTGKTETWGMEIHIWSTWYVNSSRRKG